MSISRQTPTQPPNNNRGFDWELEETLVDRRRRLIYRLTRPFRGLATYFWLLVIGSLVYALFDEAFMRAFLQVTGLALQIIALLSIGLMQFVLIFWFLSRSRQYTIMPGAEGVSFKDYRGQPEVVEQAEQIVTLLRGVKAFEDAGGEPLNGLLLEGPPGTGKTWLAQAISTEAGVPFYYVDTASLQGMFMGTSSLKVGRMYSKARKAAKEYGAAVIFLDEIDSVGSRGGVSSVGGDDKRGGGDGGMGMSGGMGLLNTLLIEMSGFALEHGWRARLRAWWYKKVLHIDVPKPHKRVLTIGATNRVDALDPALLRPGRFDKKVRIDAPDMEGRRDIFAYYLSKITHDESMNPLVLATETPGYTPADIKYLLNEALRHALYDGRQSLNYRDFQYALPEHERGIRAPVKHMNPEARERLAYYQAGIAVAVRLFLPGDRIARISIVRQGLSWGDVAHFSARESFQGLRTSVQIVNRLRVAVAGRAAEIEFLGLGSQTLGDYRQIDRVRNILNSMAVTGMFGHLGGSLYINGMPRELVSAMEEAYQKALLETRAALRENQHIVTALKQLLMEREELVADEIRAFFDQYGLHTPEPSLVRFGEEVNLREV